MFGVSHIEMIVQIALNLRAVTCNLYNHFCMAELLRKFILGDEEIDRFIDVRGKMFVGSLKKIYLLRIFIYHM